MGVPLWSYPLTQFQAVTRYLQLALWPHPRVFEYGTFRVERAGEVIPLAAVVGPLLAGTTFALRTKPALGFDGTWCCGILAPASLAPATTQMFVKHRMYLPLATVVLGAHRLLGRRALAWGAVVAVACGIGKARRNYDYRSQLARWSKTVEQRPENPRARQGLAAASAELGRLDEAIEPTQRGRPFAARRVHVSRQPRAGARLGEPPRRRDAALPARAPPRADRSQDPPQSGHRPRLRRARSGRPPPLSRGRAPEPHRAAVRPEPRGRARSSGPGRRGHRPRRSRPPAAPRLRRRALRPDGGARERSPLRRGPAPLRSGAARAPRRHRVSHGDGRRPGRGR
jgi:hypothetical protein